MLKCSKLCLDNLGLYIEKKQQIILWEWKSKFYLNALFFTESQKG